MNSDILNLIVFPVLNFNKYFFSVVKDIDSLTRSTKAGLNNGVFDNLEIIDSSAQYFKVTEARKIGGIGFARGFNLFLNQRIRVELTFSEEVINIPLEKVRIKLMKVINGDRYFWESGGYFDELINIVENSKSIDYLISDLVFIVNKKF
jgi:hypothetical protein